MDSLDLTKYWFDSSDSDYETMKLLYNNKKNTWYLYLWHLLI